MKLIFGLGNPGAQYAGTRHNVGADALASIYQDVLFTKKDKFKAEIGELTIDGEKILLARPLTYYNLVGESYRSICDFYKLTPENSLIIHDELSLPFGTVRVRVGGSDAGNNGIKSINQHGGQNSWRLRVGVASELRSLMGDTDFVLGRFSQDEARAMKATLYPTLIAIIDAFNSEQLSATSHKHDVA